MAAQTLIDSSCVRACACVCVLYI